MVYRIHEKRFWLDEACDAVINYTSSHHRNASQIVCAVGMTPSCPIHFGILREAAIMSFITEELKRKGINTRFIYYWDDYDHFCKIPYFTSKDLVQAQLGNPLTEVQDFTGVYSSYAVHIMRDFEECLRHLDIFPEYNYQSHQYQSGIYNGCIHTALINRKKIQHILNRTDTESGSDTDSFFPLQVYCPSCGKDTCTVLAYDEEKQDICFRCSCGYSGVYNIEKNFRGKLQWKINWAVRWHMDGVCAEASGENHLCKNGSFHAASRVCQEILGETPPLNIEYKFIGIPGSAKVSGQMGTPVLARTLIDILEPALLRWLLLIHSPDKPFKIDITNGIFALYREWDLFCANVMLTESDSLQRRIYTIASGSSEYHYCGASFSQLVTAVMCSGGDKARALAFSFRISGVTQYSESYQKRFDCAWKYVTQYHPEKKVQIRQTVNIKFSAACSQELLHAVVVFRQEVAESDCQHTVKKALASAADSVSKKELCRALYNLLISRNDGPPIDSLVSLIGKEHVIKLLDI